MVAYSYHTPSTSPYSISSSHSPSNSIGHLHTLILSNPYSNSSAYQISFYHILWWPHLQIIIACDFQVFRFLMLEFSPSCFLGLGDGVRSFLLLGSKSLLLLFFHNLHCNVKYKSHLWYRLLEIKDALLKIQGDEGEWTICHLLFLVKFRQCICDNEMWVILLGRQL